MSNGDEVVTPSTASPAPLPGESGAPPTPANVLAWIGSAHAQAWFPSRHATATGTNRDALDDPLNHLRAAGLVRIAEWERGSGQGYVLTPQGEAALAAGGEIPHPAVDSETTVAETSESAPAIPPKPAQSDPPWPVVVTVLFVLNLVWFLVGLVMVLRAGLPVWPFLAEGNIDIAHRTGAVYGNDLLRGEWWRLVTACFVHGNGAHLLLNLFALILVGPIAEDLWGRRRLIIIYILSGLAGSCLSMILAPASMQAGASGAIWGLLMSVAAWLILYRRTLERDVVVEATQRLTVCIVLNAMFSLLPGISWQGHLGGAVAGFLVAILLNAMGSASRGRRILALVLLLVFVLGSVGGLVAAMHGSKTWIRFRQGIDEEQSRRVLREAIEDYDRDIAPLLAQLSPLHSKLAMDLAGNQLIRVGERRNKERVAEVRARLTELKGIADSAVSHLDVPPVGNQGIDRRRERARAFAAARSRSFAIVLRMLDSPAVPDAAAWSEWEKARHEADALWPQLSR